MAQSGAAAGLAADSELLSGVSVGTFRWKRGKTFEPMPTPADGPPRFELRGWGPYLKARAGASFLQRAQSDLSTVDALSFPLSFIYAMCRMDLSPKNLETQGISELNVVFAGSTAHAEQRLLFDTNYFAEIGLCYSNMKNVNLYFVGPEAASAASLRKAHKKKTGKNNNNKKKKNKTKGVVSPQVTTNTTVSHVKGTSTEFFQRHRPELLPCGSSGNSVTVLMGFNPGFGSGNAPLVASWTNDLLFLARHNVPVIFTQANDYSDLRGELMVIQGVIGAKFVLPPMRNPFPMATTAHEPGRRETWSCGNSFVYAWQGYASGEMQRRAEIFDREPDTLKRRLEQIVSLQLAADRAGGSPPSAAGGAGSIVMSQIRITVDEVGQVDLSSYLKNKSANVKPKKSLETKTPESRDLDPKDQANGNSEVRHGKKSDKDAKATKKANHLAFMEDLGRTAVARGYMPPMDMVNAYKESVASSSVPSEPSTPSAASAVSAANANREPSARGSSDKKHKAETAETSPKPEAPAVDKTLSIVAPDADKSAIIRKRGLDLALELD